MANELKATVINMKTLSQNISDPVVIGAGEAGGRVLKIVFTQEAAAQFTPGTKVYLSWYHQTKKVKGYNVFTEITDKSDEDCPPTWEIKYPKSMLYEGDVLACIQLVDEVSIATSNNFIIHILQDPNDGASFVPTDDFSDFQKMVITIQSLSTQMEKQLIAQKLEFEDMQLEFMEVRRLATESHSFSEEAKRIAEEALNTISQVSSVVEEARNISIEAKNTSEEAKNTIDEVTAIAADVNNNINELSTQVEIIEQNVVQLQNEAGDVQNKIDIAQQVTLETAYQQLIEYMTIQEFGINDEIING